ncbi:MAG: triose-phosphate isomerase [Chlamydiota bacterium]
MQRVPIIAGNWKMYKTSAEARAYIETLNSLIASTDRLIYLAVPFTALEAASDASQGSKITIGAQNMHDQAEGAFTGEISAAMLKSSGAGFVLLGHSERRNIFLETDVFIHRKLQRALSEGIQPILCIGEMLEQRERGDHESVLEMQLTEGLGEITGEQMKQVIIAYEPVWAIGTGKTATAEIAQATHHFIRRFLEKRFGKEISERIPLLYGGSVKPDNIAALMQQSDIDGVLVGGASLDPKSFVQIIHY